MSFNKNNKKSFSNKPSVNKTAATAYCGACFKAGKSVEEYTSHWTRASKGTDAPVVCPLILSAECGFCHEVGHWTKMCPKIKEKQEKNTDVSSKPIDKKTIKKVEKSNDFISKSAFHALSTEDSDDEDDNDKDDGKVSSSHSPVVTIVNDNEMDFPVLNTPHSIKSQSSSLTRVNWASLLKKDFVVPVSSTPVVSRKFEEKPEEKSFKLKPIIITSWADDNDSDEDYDDEDFLPTGSIVLSSRANVK